MLKREPDIRSPALSPTETAILRLLASKAKTMYPGLIAKRTGIRPSNVNNALRMMIGKGYVSRRKAVKKKWYEAAGSKPWSVFASTSIGRLALEAHLSCST